MGCFDGWAAGAERLDELAHGKKEASGNLLALALKCLKP